MDSSTWLEQLTRCAAPSASLIGLETRSWCSRKPKSRHNEINWNTFSASRPEVWSGVLHAKGNKFQETFTPRDVAVPCFHLSFHAAPGRLTVVRSLLGSYSSYRASTPERIALDGSVACQAANSCGRVLIPSTCRSCSRAIDIAVRAHASAQGVAARG